MMRLARGEYIEREEKVEVVGVESSTLRGEEGLRGER